MLKKLALPLVMLAGMLAFTPRPAEARWHVGVSVGAPAYYYGYSAPVYVPDYYYYPRTYYYPSYTYTYGYPRWHHRHHTYYFNYYRR